jgi:hypothetical protein
MMLQWESLCKPHKIHVQCICWSFLLHCISNTARIFFIVHNVLILLNPIWQSGKIFLLKLSLLPGITFDKCHSRDRSCDANSKTGDLWMWDVFKISDFRSSFSSILTSPGRPIAEKEEEGFWVRRFIFFKSHCQVCFKSQSPSHTVTFPLLRFATF